MVEFTFFWGNASPFSNWHKSIFEYKGLRFTCSEQAMMWEKAMMFKDERAANWILGTSNPRIQKELGRKVTNYDDALWSLHRKEIVYDILYQKFTQNLPLLKVLLDTGNTMIVEASPYDKVWGVGMSEDDPLIHDHKNWKGMNLLGLILTELREDILNSQDQFLCGLKAQVQ